jgi:hypothetical protein
VNGYRLLKTSKRPFLEQSVETAAVRKSGCWISGVTEEGDVLCGKAVAPVWVFPNNSASPQFSTVKEYIIKLQPQHNAPVMRV